MTDVACAWIVLVVGASVLALYGARAARGRASTYARVKKAGGSPLLGEGAMNAGYWALQPIARACVAVGIDANAVTAVSLVLSLLAGIAFAGGLLGVGALLAAIAGLGDAIDGLVARISGEASEAGEVFDAAVDRYAELFFLGGLAVHYADRPAAIALTIAALGGAFMFSYASAKAEAMRVQAPRGAMRRQERAAYLTVGAALTPIASWPVNLTPILVALAIVAVVGNASAVSRLVAIARAVRRPEPHVAPGTAPKEGS